MSAPAFDLKKALTAHEAAIGYAVRLQTASSTEADGGGERLVALSALSVLAHEAVCLHRAIEVLAREGWAFGAPILMRSMLDLALSAVVIVNADRPDVAAFEYLYAFTKSDDYKSSPEAQKEALESINKHMEQMTLADREAAASYLASSKLSIERHTWRLYRHEDVSGRPVSLGYQSQKGSPIGCVGPRWEHMAAHRNVARLGTSFWGSGDLNTRGSRK